jgi:LysR family transcriptional activator of mexEF-oprN operon
MANIIDNDLRRLDLNLLLVFRAVLAERSVTRAAQRLFLGQPAVSGALKRLRRTFDDALFVRTPRGMQPTPRALELARDIEPLLEQLHGAITRRPGFDPARAERVFRIGISDSLELTLMPYLVGRFAREAPGVRLVTRSADAGRAPALLDDDTVELAVGVFRGHASWHSLRRLFGWRFVCVYNPQLIGLRGKRISLDEYIRHPHVLTSFTGGLHGYIDEQLERLQRRRRVIFSSPGFATSPFIVRHSAVLTTVPDFIARSWSDALGLAVSPLPFAVPGHDVSVLWKSSSDRDPGLAWLVSMLVAAGVRGPSRNAPTDAPVREGRRRARR